MADNTTTSKASRPVSARSKAAAFKSHGSKHVNGFFSFIRTQGVIGLAVGLVIGGAVSVVVKSLIDNIVMPPLGFILGSADGLKGLVWHLGKTPSGKDAVLHYGTFLNDIINFLVIALTIYLVIHFIGLDRLDKKKE
jgi:large conductance mechanosensitive channel